VADAAGDLAGWSLVPKSGAINVSLPHMNVSAPGLCGGVRSRTPSYGMVLGFGLVVGWGALGTPPRKPEM
jgi:hypothetical protein